MEITTVNHTKMVGRPTTGQIYVPVTYNTKEYILGLIVSHEEPFPFVFDKEDYDEVVKYNWHRCSANYISTSVYIDGKKKELFLHNLVMKRPLYLGKGQLETVDHNNRINTDNRKENLRVVSQSEQNFNQKTRKRIAILPLDCRITLDDIPKHIWYIKANGAHGDRFAIELKTEGVCWKTTSSKSVLLTEKLEAAKTKLQELYIVYPHLNPENPDRLAEITALKKSYEEIVEHAILKL